MAYLTSFVVCLGLMVVPLLAMGILLIIGRRRPDVAKRGLRQLTAGWTPPRNTPSEFELHRKRRQLENEVIRRYGPPPGGPQRGDRQLDSPEGGDVTK